MLSFFVFLSQKSRYLKRNISLSHKIMSFKTSCEFAGSFKIKMQMYKLILVLTLFRSFSLPLFIEKFYGRFVCFEDTVTYFDKIVIFPIGGSKSIC